MTFKSLFCSFLFLIVWQANAIPAPAKNPPKLENQLLEIYQSHRQTFFCELPFSKDGHTLKDQMKVKWMPVVSYKEYAKDLLCYKEKICINKKGEAFKGLRCCEVQDLAFQKMKADLHNYVPETAALKRQRTPLHFGLSDKAVLVEECQIKVDKKHKILEPNENLRGTIARTYLYMAQQYPLKLSTEEKTLFLAWHQAYPPTGWEKERNEKIKAIQGNGNSYIQ